MNPHSHDGHFLWLYAYDPGVALDGSPFHFKASPGQRIMYMPILYTSYRQQTISVDTEQYSFSKSQAPNAIRKATFIETHHWEHS